MTGIIATVETQINVLMCRIPRIFDGFKKIHRKNVRKKNFNFGAQEIKCLNLEQQKLYPYLIQLFNEKSTVSIVFYIKTIHTVGVIGIRGKHGLLD